MSVLLCAFFFKYLHIFDPSTNYYKDKYSDILTELGKMKVKGIYMDKLGKNIKII